MFSSWSLRSLCTSPRVIHIDTRSAPFIPNANELGYSSDCWQEDLRIQRPEFRDPYQFSEFNQSSFEVRRTSSFPSTVFAALGSLETLPSQCDRHADFELERLLRLTFCEVIGALEAAAAQLQINSTSRYESFALRCINVYSGSGILPSDTASQISMRSSPEGG